MKAPATWTTTYLKRPRPQSDPPKPLFRGHCCVAVASPYLAASACFSPPIVTSLATPAASLAAVPPPPPPPRTRDTQYGCAPSADKFCRVMHAAAALDDGQHEARRAIVVAEQMWTDDWRGEGKTDHPVLGHPNLRRLLEERGAFNQVSRL